MESEPRGTSPVPNVESPVFTSRTYAICPVRDLKPEPSDWRFCVMATAAGSSDAAPVNFSDSDSEGGDFDGFDDGNIA